MVMGLMIIEEGLATRAVVQAGLLGLNSLIMSRSMDSSSATFTRSNILGTWNLLSQSPRQRHCRLLTPPRLSMGAAKQDRQIRSSCLVDILMAV